MSEPLMDWQKIFAAVISAAIIGVGAKSISTPTKGDVKEMIESSLSSRPLPTMLSRNDVIELIKDKSPYNSERHKLDNNTYQIERLKEYAMELQEEDKNLYRLISEINTHMASINIKVETMLVILEEMRVKKKPVRRRATPEQQHYWEWEMLPAIPNGKHE